MIYSDSMKFALLYIRYRQLRREVYGLGLYLLFFIITGAYLVFFFYKQYEQEKNAMYAVLFLAALCVLLHRHRKDKPFIYKHLSRPYLQVFTEYTLLTFPFAITSIFTVSWYCYPVLILLIGMVPLINPGFKYKTRLQHLSLLIPACHYEWISGIRRNYLLFVFLYLAAAATCMVKILPLVFLWLLTIVITSFQQDAEPVQVLREGYQPAGKYIISKLRVNIWYISLLYTPILFFNTICNNDSLLLNILFMPAQISVVCFAVCLKYSSYRPGKSNTGNNIPLAIISLGSALPYLLPVPAILSFLYFNKARIHLKNFLND